MDDLKMVLKERDANSHKGQNGSILVIGGSADYVGAPALVALAALRSGIDLAVVAAPEKAAWQINTYSPDLITKKIKGDFFSKANIREIIEIADRFDAVAIGNGIGMRPETVEFVREICHRFPHKPKVIDADAIKAMHGQEIMNAIMTPHSREFEAYSGHELPVKEEDRIEMLMRYARKDVVMLLKGHTDIITDGTRIKRNMTGNPGMTVGGTGDVLAGLCAGFLAHGAEKFHAACAAAYLNGYIGDTLYKKMGYGFLASDMIWEIPTAIKRLV